MAYALQLRQQLGRISTQLHEITDKAIKEKRGLRSDEREKFDALATEYSDTEQSVIRFEKSAQISDTLALAGGGPSITANLEEIRDTFRLTPAQARAKERERDPYARAFHNYIRTGFDNLESDEKQIISQRFLGNADPTATIRNSQSTTTGSQGGFAVPQGFSNMPWTLP